ncbi:hypothetical protein ACFV4G_17540 [Kitasatospora sp. NPDC059747]|uniref:hypothetical protein n=1 Tax=Kitasatospora sp. NPDC059747 TaxID=3346930 RepID=UPI0036603894
MADRCTIVVVRESGEHELYLSRFGAVGLDLALLAGPGRALALLPGLQPGDWWPDDVLCQGAALVDHRRRVLLVFAWEGPSTTMLHRAAALELLREAWAGWEVRWAFDGPADLRTYLGLDPEAVRDRERRVSPGFLVDADDADDAELAGPEPMVAVVTVGSQRCHLVAGGGDHPVWEGPALLERVARGRDLGVCRVRAEAGIHVDPARRRVGWWTLGACAQAYEMAGRWPGWTVDFWRDRFEEHVRACGGRFAPPPVDRERALAAVRAQAQEHWAARP